jgi:1-acyl-sn-glycerol-3-phosphate acyltransferase
MKKISKIEAVLRYFSFIFMYYLGHYLFRIINKIIIIGKENIFYDINTMFIGPHSTFIDSFLVRISLINFRKLILKQRIIPYDAGDKKNFFSTKFKAWCMKLLKIISVDREGMNSFLAEKLIELYCEILSEGNIILFPEGGRTKPGNNILDEFKTGVARTILIMTLKEPNFKVVPFYIDKVMSEIMPRNIGQDYIKIKSGKKGFIVIGRPINFLDICIENNSDEEKIEQVKDRARKAILALRDQIPCE